MMENIKETIMIRIFWNLKENLKKEKNGMEKDMIKMEK